MTGIGAWTPFGVGWDALWAALIEGRTAFAPVGEGFGPDPTLLAGRISDWKPFRAEFPEVRPPLPIPVTRLALVAARRACEAAGLAKIDAEHERLGFGVMLNRNRGPAQVVAKIMKPVLAKGVRKTSPLLFSQSVANAPLGAVATALGLRGPHLLTMGGGAIMTAHDAIQRGDAPGVLVGGFEELVSELFTADLDNGVIEGIRSLDQLGRGPVMSEGCVCVLLESRASAEARGARALARLASVERGLSLASRAEPAEREQNTDGRGERGWDPLSRWGAPDPDGFARLAARALARAGVEPKTIGYHAGNGAAVPAFASAEQRMRATLGLDGLGPAGRVGSLKALLGEGMGMGAIANLAWAATMVARGEITHSTRSGPTKDPVPGAGASALGLAHNVLVTHLDAHASQFAALVSPAS
ncbi:3-oxoacyl-[acyl-carrier-protein] synthase 2 [Enhygromyxa salina]|uniref:3-oxoacyl-[acyl-carrier-protein] synthase 2 n=1 Tax=Enhygromyxa salina TaxID=215803 RepID=A0A2S9YL89_9BACT|nr:beta-ketoacyl synthase N-terminal-like domain-containing protein [Enhygromyxa salina]PRQ05834.1 3-oxoacyl-[acyl-carrier-protein] synthase 2 [Enhygromyxa salina]